MPCDYKQYPIDWFSRIRPAMLERAGNCCERCAAPNYALYFYSHVFFTTADSYADARKKRYESGISDSLKIVVLTVHHIDRFPMNNAPENLRVLCLNCANRLDAKRRAKVRKIKAINALEAVQPSLPLVTSIITTI